MFTGKCLQICSLQNLAVNEKLVNFNNLQAISLIVRSKTLRVGQKARHIPSPANITVTTF